MRTSLLARTALTAYMLPFLVGGILAASRVYAWFYESATDGARTWLWFVLLVLLLTGIVLGGLLAYFVLVFLLTWFAPESPLLVLDEVSKPTVAQRLLAPAFLTVRAWATRLAPVRRK